jgi:tRNA (guanine37-N1)-methyltransferase
MFPAFFAASVLGKAIAKGILAARALDIRAHALGPHRTVDDRPFGGGCGMVMKPEPLAASIRQAREEEPGSLVALLSPQGLTFNQKAARELAREEGLILVCGRYEGVDERVIETCVDLELSVGDFVLTGGEPAAMVVMDAVARLVPGVLGKGGSAEDESFEDGLLEHAHYTRPRDFEGMEAPDVLWDGNHALIARWRREAKLARTFLRRPDLLLDAPLDKADARALVRWRDTLGEILESQAVPLPAAPSCKGPRG